MIVNKSGRNWEWPDYDKKLIQVFDWVSDCQKAIDICKGRSLALQAGGAVGVWPAYLADYFDRVVTVEPEHENYRCLASNLRDFTNVTHFNGVLSNRSGRVGLGQDPSEVENAGTWYVKAGDSVRAFTIDSLALDACDLICLDVEGHEQLALEGGIKTIQKHSPVIMIEDKELRYIGNRKGEAVEWLKSFGYQVVATAHRDVILCIQ